MKHGSRAGARPGLCSSIRRTAARPGSRSAVPERTAGVIVPLALDFLDSQHGWIDRPAAHHGGASTSVLLATSDGGQTWTAAGDRRSFDGMFLTAVDFLDAQHGWVAGDGIFATSDGGATWTKVVGGLWWVAGLAAVDQTHVWAGADGGGIVSTVDAAGDTAPPTTLSEGARGWVREATHLALTASDAGGSGVATTEYSLDGGAWQPYLTPLDFPAPADHSGDGSHSVGIAPPTRAGSRSRCSRAWSARTRCGRSSGCGRASSAATACCACAPASTMPARPTWTSSRSTSTAMA